MTNEDQRAFWNGPSGERWAHEQARLDAMLRSYGEAAIEAAHAQPGESVLDVGCGCGDTSLALADRVGTSGRVVGLDISAPMIARARERSASHPNLSLRERDASTGPLEVGAFDLVYSRFGVMFFADPVATFTHLRVALRPRGRIAFVCWRPLAENPWARVPFEAAATILGRPEPSPPDAPGPFAFGDPARVRMILARAGFAAPSIVPFDTTNRFGVGGSIGDAAREIVRLGPVARLLVDRTEAQVAATIGAVEGAVREYAKEGGGIGLAAAGWIVRGEVPRS